MNDPLLLQCVYAHPYPLICCNIIMLLELGMDNVKKFVDFNADVITSLFVMFRPLVEVQQCQVMSNQRRSVHCQIATDLDNIHDTRHRGYDAFETRHR